jgi:uncharacterized protein with LGFP repeats
MRDIWREQGYERGPLGPPESDPFHPLGLWGNVQYDIWSQVFVNGVATATWDGSRWTCSYGLDGPNQKPYNYVKC